MPETVQGERRMTQMGFDFTPYPANPFKKGSQNYRVYERLKQGPVTNVKIVKEMCILNSTGRISEVREYLKDHGMDVAASPLGGGYWEYRIAGGKTVAA
jgi:hypothetical protein